MKHSIPHRRLGRLNRQVSEFGLGCAQLASHMYGRENSEANAIAVVQRALELGIDYLDTSPGYGESEARLGKALRGVPREAYFLATKTGTGTRPQDYSREGTLRSVEKSLHLLGTDYLDLVQIHDPDVAGFEQALTTGGALEALLELKAQKVIGGIGLGVRNHDFHRRAIAHEAFDTILTYGDFNLVHQSARADLFEAARQNDKAIILGSSVLMGYLTDRPWDELLREHGAIGQESELQRARQVRQWAEEHNLSVLHLAIQYVLREARLSTVLVGGSRVDEVEQNVSAATTPLPDDIWRQLQEDLGIV
ncbi:MAG TPA: aldo/keto reductase [Abditibacteriaceae bacterium]|jgi:aryl-alcohol dehydrogenase-like predicted oxidoreductase